jgi:hypothetical protein
LERTDFHEKRQFADGFRSLIVAPFMNALVPKQNKF